MSSFYQRQRRAERRSQLIVGIAWVLVAVVLMVAFGAPTWFWLPMGFWMIGKVQVS